MTTTDRRDATDAQFADELARLERLDVADVAADVVGDVLHKWMGGDRDYYDAPALAVVAALKPAPGTDELCGDCDHPCGVNGCGCPDECAAKRSEPLTASGCPLWHRNADGWCIDDRPHLALRLPAPETDSSGPTVQRDEVCECSHSRGSHLPEEIPATYRCTGGPSSSCDCLRYAAVAGPQRDHDEEEVVLGSAIIVGDYPDGLYERIAGAGVEIGSCPSVDYPVWADGSQEHIRCELPKQHGGEHIGDAGSWSW